MISQTTSQFPVMRILPILVVLVMTIAPAAAIAQLPVTRTSSPVSWVITPADLTESTDAPPALPTGGVRRKSNTTPGWTATAVSSQVIYQDGEITFTAPTGQVLAVGLSLYNTGPSPSDLEHSIRFSASKATIYFGATLGPSLGTYTPTTKFTIRRKSNLQIEYLVDGQLRHTTSNIVVGRLQADCSLNTAGAQITSCFIDQGDSDADGLPDAWQIAYFPAFPNYADLWPFDSNANADGDPANNLREFLDGSHPRNPISYLNPVTWAASVGAELPDSLGSIRKTSTSLTWDVSATSKDANTLEEHTLIEDGKFTFRAVRPPSSTTVTPLLAVGFFPATNLVNTASSLADLPYAIVLSSNGTAAARRPGTTTNTSLGEFNSETSFSIERVNGIVTFIKDGVAFPVPSTPLLSGPLHIKCRLYQPGAELTECRLYTGDIDFDKLPDAWETTYLTPASPDSGPTLIDLQNFLPSSPSPLTPDPANPDLDSLNNFQEYRDGTHPLRQLLTSADVLWLAQPASNVTFPSPTTITKATGTPVAWDTDAIALYAPGSTSPLLLQESGKLAFSVSSGSHLAVGLTFQNNSRAFGDLEYSIIVTPQGTAAVYSGTTNVKSLGRYNSNTRFIIRRLGGRIDFLSDNVVLHSVLLPTAKRTLPLIADSSFRTPGSSIVDARLYTGDLDEDGLPDTWEITHLRRLNQGDPDFAALDGFSPEMDSDTDTVSNAIEFNAGTDPLQPLSKPQPIAWTVFAKTFNPYAPANPTGTLRKISHPTPTTSATWNADAISTQTLPSDGSVTFTASPTGNLAVGLTYQNTLRTVADLEYAFVLTPTTTTTVGTAAIRRPETTNLATGPYTSSTVFTLRRASNVISFLRDGVTLYTSTVPTPPGSQFVDCAILQFDHQIDSAYIHDAAQDLDGDSIPDAWELAILPPGSNFNALQNDFAPYGDYDKDGLANAREFQLGTDPTRSDTDGDGLPDAWEVEHGSNPNESDAFADADGDGISNQAEKQADETISPGPTYIFTSERIKTASFDGEAGHKLGEHETIQTNVTPYWALDVINPAYQAWLQDMSDRQNGDADDQNNNTDPGDPRDEYYKANPPDETIEERVDEDTEGAIEGYDEEDYVISTEEYLIPFTNPKGTYTADYGPKTILPSGHTEESNVLFSDSKLTQKIDNLAWGKLPTPLTHGWRGDGTTGVQPKNAHAQLNSKSTSFDFEGETYTYHTTNASAKHIQVRLQSSKPITEPTGLSRSFILVKTTTDLTPGNTTPPVRQFIGTVILTISEGKTISASAGGTAGLTYLKHEQEIAYVELRPTTFTENKRIDLDLLPVDLDALEPTEGISNPIDFPEAPEGSDAVVALNFDDDDEDGGSSLTPDSEDSQVAQEDDLLPIKLHRLEILGQAASFKLKFDSQYVKIWKNADKTDPVTSDSTEFNGSQDIVVFAEGIKITPAVNSNEEGNLITQRVKIGTSGSWIDGEKLKTRVGRPIVPVFGAISIGGTLAGDGAYIPVIFPEVGVSGEADLKTYLQGAGKKRSRFSSSAYVVKGKDAQGKEQNYTVELRDSEKVLKMALQSDGADVAINTHANMGLGPAFKTGLNAISDFTNLSGLGKASIHVLSLRQHNNHPALALGNDVINAPTNNNLPVLNRLRFLNNGNIGNGQAFTLQGQGDGRYHYFDTENGLNQVVVTSTGDVPQQLKYRSLFIDSCSSGPHFIESFQHGMFIYTTRVCGEPENIKIFVEGIIKGKTGNAIAAELNGNSTMGAVYSAHQF